MVALAGTDAHGHPWHLAPCLVALLRDADDLAPHRRRTSDGTIGDSAHQARRSDHNPDSSGTVAALDLGHDPAAGFDTWKIAQTLAAHIADGSERRVAYLISGDPSRRGDLIFHAVNGRWQWDPHPATNNSHNSHHLHVSTVSDPALRGSVAAWPLVQPPAPAPADTGEPTMLLIQRGPNGPVAATDFVAKRALGPSQLAAAKQAIKAQTRRDAAVTIVDPAVYDAIPG